MSKLQDREVDAVDKENLGNNKKDNASPAKTRGIRKKKWPKTASGMPLVNSSNATEIAINEDAPGIANTTSKATKSSVYEGDKIICDHPSAQDELGSTPSNIDCVQSMKLYSKKRKRVRINHNISPLCDNTPSDLVDNDPID